VKRYRKVKIFYKFAISDNYFLKMNQNVVKYSVIIKIMKQTFTIALMALLFGFGLTSQSVAQDTAADFDKKGNEEQNKGNDDTAIADYGKAIALDSKYAYNDRGTAKDDKGDTAGAISDYDQAIVLNPNLAIAYENRSASKKAKGDLKGAEDDMRHAKALEANDGK
jgi:tetratricopeptide (TPR) repeat protein